MTDLISRNEKNKNICISSPTFTFKHKMYNLQQVIIFKILPMKFIILKNK